MLSRLANLVGGTGRATYPSLVVIIGQGSTNALHVVPESGDTECFGDSRPATAAFSFGGATERSREQLGSITLHVNDGEGWHEFLDDIGKRATRLLSKREKPGLEGEALHALDQALRCAVSETLQERSKRSCKMANRGVPESTDDYNNGIDGPLRVVTWDTLPDIPQLTGPTIPEVGRRFFNYSPSVILKLRADEGEAVMTLLAHAMLSLVAPNLISVVKISGPPTDHGLLLSRQPGTPLVELWPTLGPADRNAVERNLTELLVRMRAPSERFNYYGRPGKRPYITPSELGPPDEHAYCLSRLEWNQSRVQAIRNAAEEAEVDDDRRHVLERSQHDICTDDATIVTSPVLTHGDLSDRNILIDPSTLQVTGLIDWEMANVAPAYFEYAAARLSGGHDQAWRKVLLDILRQVLRKECERISYEVDISVGSSVAAKDSEKLYQETLAAWNSLVDVERAAQGYSDDCYWTFEDGAAATNASESI